MDKIIVVASTHWDREWYRTFQDFQIRLCDLMNNLLDLLEKDEDFLCYTFDGQSVVLDDYLEIYPENLERIKSLVKKGKLAFGPLYNLPDEFISGGEALIRNFLIGDEVCKNIGGKINAGYLPDNFGHISQMPQILNGVGIDSAFFFRGTNIDTLTSKEFYWGSPDGSVVLGEYMILGYWSLKSWGKLDKSVIEHFKLAYEKLKKHSKLNTFLLINGSDHLYQDPDFTTMIKEVKDVFPNLSIKNASLEDYAKLAKEAASNLKNIPKIYGELRDFRYGPDPTSVASCRSSLKRLLFNTLAEVERYAEPLATIGFSIDKEEKYPRGFFKKAWKLILKSLGHDAITGCSTDEVMLDVKSYITHAKQIAERISGLALEEITNKLNTSNLADNEQYLTLFNPHPFDFSGFSEQIIHIKKEDLLYKDFKILDMKGNNIPYELLNVWEDVITQEFKYNSKEKVYRTCYKILFNSINIPAFGIKSYIIRKNTLLDKRENELYIRQQPSNTYIENQLYKIVVNQDASINVFDKQKNVWYENFNTFISRGEIGDEYQHVSPLFDEHIFARLKSFSVIHNSKLSQKLRIISEMTIPKSMDSRIFGRSEEMMVCTIFTDVILYDNLPRINFHVEIENLSSDHILYAKFPTKFKDSSDYSYISFDEVTRNNEVLEFDPDLKSTQSFLKPMQKYAGIEGKDGNMHILAKGIYEYHTKENNGGMDFYLTLLRSTSYLFHGLPISWMDGQHSTTPIVETVDSKELGKSIIEYALILNNNEVASEADTYLYPPRSIDTYKKESNKKLNNEFSFIRIDSKDIMISAMKKHEHSDGIILRIYNTKEYTVNTTIHTMLDIKGCKYCDLLEQPFMEAEHTTNEVKISVKAKKIITLLIEWGQEYE